MTLNEAIKEHFSKDFPIEEMKAILTEIESSKDARVKIIQLAIADRTLKSDIVTVLTLAMGLGIAIGRLEAKMTKMEEVN